MSTLNSRINSIEAKVDSLSVKKNIISISEVVIDSPVSVDLIPVKLSLDPVEDLVINTIVEPVAVSSIVLVNDVSKEVVSEFVFSLEKENVLEMVRIFVFCLEFHVVAFVLWIVDFVLVKKFDRDKDFPRFLCYFLK
jgi:hypothetical protein